MRHLRRFGLRLRANLCLSATEVSTLCTVPSLAPELAVHVHCADVATDSLDPEALEVCVDVLKRAVGYYLRLMTRDAQRKLHLPLAESPECESLSSSSILIP